MPKPAVPYDWPYLRGLYVQGETPISLTDLAQQTGAPLRSLQRHSADEGWVQQRREYQDAVASKARALAVNETARHRVGSLEGIETAIDVLSRQLQAMGEGLAGKDWESEDPNSISKASASIATALDKVARCRELLTGGADSRAQVDLATLLADLRSG